MSGCGALTLVLHLNVAGWCLWCGETGGGEFLLGSRTVWRAAGFRTVGRFTSDARVRAGRAAQGCILQHLLPWEKALVLSVTAVAESCWVKTGKELA